MDIVPLSDRHCEGVAQLHLDFLRTEFRGRPGRSLLRLYYEALAGSGGGCGFVAEGESGVEGFVCGVWNHSMVRSSLLRHHAFRLLLWTGAQALIRPALIWDAVTRFSESPAGRSATAKGCELRPIVVSPRARGTGVANRLVDALQEEARERGFPTIHLFVHNDNVAAISFYRKAGFRLSGPAKEGMLRFERRISGAREPETKDHPPRPA